MGRRTRLVAICLLLAVLSSAVGTVLSAPDQTLAIVAGGDAARRWQIHLPLIMRQWWLEATPTATHSAYRTPTPTRTQTPTRTPTRTTVPGACPDAGQWTGETDQGYTVSMNVSDRPDCQVLEMTLTIWCPRFVWRATVGPAPIAHNHFVASAHDSFLRADIDVVGDFSSTSHASGTWYSSSDCQGTWYARHSP
jgi:hypothetical protein